MSCLYAKYGYGKVPKTFADEKFFGNVRIYFGNGENTNTVTNKNQEECNMSKNDYNQNEKQNQNFQNSTNQSQDKSNNCSNSTNSTNSTQRNNNQNNNQKNNF